MALDSYASLSAAIATWATRPYTEAQIDEFIALAEAAFNRRLKSYQREHTTTWTTDVNGEFVLPADYSEVVSIEFGAPLRQVSWAALRVLNPSRAGGIPGSYATSGTKLRLDFPVAGDLAVTYKQKLTPLSAEAPSNWLLDLAPDAYLWMTLAQQRAFEEEWQTSAGFEARANSILDELGLQSDLAQFGRAGVTIQGNTP